MSAQQQFKAWESAQAPFLSSLSKPVCIMHPTCSLLNSNCGSRTRAACAIPCNRNAKLDYMVGKQARERCHTTMVVFVLPTHAPSAKFSLAAVILLDSVLEGNSATLAGGAVILADLGSIDIQRCRLEANHVGLESPASGDGSEMTRGGALAARGASVVSVADSIFTANSAFKEGHGGALTLTGNASLELGPDVRVYGNSAGFTGGGLAIDNGRFSPQAVRQAFFNNTAKYDPDIAVPTERITLIHNISQLNITSRLGVSEDLPVVGVRLSGTYGLPSVHRVQAFLDGAPLDLMTTQPDGVANFRLNIRKPPGLYNVSFRPMDEPDVAPVSLLVNVTGCGLGEVSASSGDACITCVAGSFSFNPQNTTCDACPANAGEGAAEGS